jgi:hypothetical protein
LISPYGVEPVALHDLRHIFSNNAFEQGSDRRDLAEAARHANGR